MPLEQKLRSSVAERGTFRIDNHTVRFVGSIVEISMFIEMALGYPPTMNR